MGDLSLLKRNFIESSTPQCATCVFPLFWTKHQGRVEKTISLSLVCVFVNGCILTASLTVKWFNTRFHKHAFSCFLGRTGPKLFFFSMHNLVLDVSFRSSKKVVVTKQSKTPSYETLNLLFCPPFWWRSIGRMNVFGVCSSFFHACCSEAQNNET